MLEKISTPNAPKAIGPYSQAIVVNNMVYTSGQIPVNPQTGEIPQDIENQAKQVFENIKNLLEASGTSINNVIKTTVFIKNMQDFPVVNGIYAEYFTKPYPARSHQSDPWLFQVLIRRGLHIFVHTLLLQCLPYPGTWFPLYLLSVLPQIHFRT